MIYVGIDPGIGGAVAAITEENGVELYAAPVGKTGPKGRNEPDLQDMNTLLRAFCPIDLAVIEHVTPQPKFGASNFIFGGSYWAWLAMLVSRGVRYETVRPKTWQKVFDICGKGEGSTKAQAVRVAKGLFPTTEGITQSTADALLLAEYARRASK